MDSSQPHVVVNISKKAVITIDAIGFTGTACMKIVEPLQTALGVASKIEAKPEFYAQEQAQAFN